MQTSSMFMMLVLTGQYMNIINANIMDTEK